jgi:hypothetical protein
MARQSPAKKRSANKNNPRKRSNDIKDMAEAAVASGPDAVADFNKQAKAKVAAAEETAKGKKSRTTDSLPTATRSKRVVAKKPAPKATKLSRLEVSARRSAKKPKITKGRDRIAEATEVASTKIDKLKESVQRTKLALKNRMSDPTHAEKATQLKAALDAHIKKHGKNLGSWYSGRDGDNQPHPEQAERNRLEVEYDNHMAQKPAKFDEKRNNALIDARRNHADAKAALKAYGTDAGAAGSRDLAEEKAEDDARQAKREADTKAKKEFERSPAGKRVAFANGLIKDHKGRDVPRHEFLDYKSATQMANDTVEGEATQDWMAKHSADISKKIEANRIGKRYYPGGRKGRRNSGRTDTETLERVMSTTPNAKIAKEEQARLNVDERGKEVLRTDVSGNAAPAKAVDISELEASNRAADEGKAAAARPSAGEVRSKQISDAITKLRSMKRQ